MTYTGIVSPAGVGETGYWKTICKDYSKKTLKRSKFIPEDFLSEKDLKYLNRPALFSLPAAKMILDQLKSLKNIGLILGSAYGNIHECLISERQALSGDLSCVSPMQFPHSVYNAPGSFINIKFGLSSLCELINTGRNSGLDAVGLGYKYISKGYYKKLICGGAEALAEEVNLKSNKFTPDLGEGAGLVLLTSLAEAKKSKLPILAEIIAYESFFEKDKDLILANLLEANSIPLADLSFFTGNAYQALKDIPKLNLDNILGPAQACLSALEAITAGLFLKSQKKITSDRKRKDYALLTSSANFGQNSLLLLKRYL